LLTDSFIHPLSARQKIQKMVINKNVMLRISSTTLYSIECCTSNRKPSQHSCWWMQIPKLIQRLTCLQVPQDERKLSQEAVIGEGLDELLLAG